MANCCERPGSRGTAQSSLRSAREATGFAFNPSQRSPSLRFWQMRSDGLPPEAPVWNAELARPPRPGAGLLEADVHRPLGLDLYTFDLTEDFLGFFERIRLLLRQTLKRIQIRYELAKVDLHQGDF